MPSFAKYAILATGLLGPVLGAAQHKRFHEKKSVAPIEARAAEFFAPGILQGQNVRKNQGPISLNGTGPFLVEFQNSANVPIDLVLWSSTGQAGNWGVLTVNVAAPNITVPIPIGENITVSFDPAQYTEANGFAGANQAISGAFAPLYPGTVPAYFGGIDNTWGEFTFTSLNQFSTVDVSRLANMTGTDMTISTFPAQNEPLSCVSDMNTCVYLCPEGQQSCNGAAASNCAGNTGCMGMSAAGGYTLVTFL